MEEQEQKTFKDLKEKFSCTHVLKFLDFIKPFEVRIDASDFTIGGVFMQDGHLIYSENKKFYEAQL
jgi:hypothetical protein